MMFEDLMLHSLLGEGGTVAGFNHRPFIINNSHGMYPHVLTNLCEVKTGEKVVSLFHGLMVLNTVEAEAQSVMKPFETQTGGPNYIHHGYSTFAIGESISTGELMVANLYGTFPQSYNTVPLGIGTSPKKVISVCSVNSNPQVSSPVTAHVLDGTKVVISKWSFEMGPSGYYPVKTEMNPNVENGHSNFEAMRLARGRNPGELHLAWTSKKSGITGKNVFYTFSSDYGATWLPTRAITTCSVEEETRLLYGLTAQGDTSDLMASTIQSDPRPNGYCNLIDYTIGADSVTEYPLFFRSDPAIITRAIAHYPLHAYDMSYRIFVYQHDQNRVNIVHGIPDEDNLNVVEVDLSGSYLDGYEIISFEKGYFGGESEFNYYFTLSVCMQKDGVKYLAEHRIDFDKAEWDWEPSLKAITIIDETSENHAWVAIWEGLQETTAYPWLYFKSGIMMVYDANANVFINPATSLPPQTVNFDGKLVALASTMGPDAYIAGHILPASAPETITYNEYNLSAALDTIPSTISIFGHKGRGIARINAGENTLGQLPTKHAKGTGDFWDGNVVSFSVNANGSLGVSVVLSRTGPYTVGVRVYDTYEGEVIGEERTILASSTIGDAVQFYWEIPVRSGNEIQIQGKSYTPGQLWSLDSRPVILMAAETPLIVQNDPW